ncbi:hypothetical protein [Marinobacter sp. DUT-1]|uniref:hypothetical protein n=1 Tax=Marinobacter sp. DUT-1 TaxID=3412037 RepID=UPI003D187535
MQSLTRMFVPLMLCLGASLAVADGMESSAERMKDDGMMAEESMEKGMEKDDMTADMDQGMKEDTMDTMDTMDDMDDMEEANDMETMPMEDDTMNKDTME